MEFVIINGTVTSRKETIPAGLLSNDAFVFTQKVWYGFGGIPLLTENIVLIERQLESIGSELPDLFRNTRELFRRCKRMLNKNRFYRSGHLVFTFIVSGSKTEFMITAEYCEDVEFPIAENGVLVNFATYRKNSQNRLGALACQNTAFWKAVSTENRGKTEHSSVILNEKNCVCEGIASNVFLLKDKILVTPSPESGCFNDALRAIIIEQAARLNIKTFESDEIQPAAFFDADEAFFVSEANGIEWILGIESKRFVRSFSPEIHQKINEFMQAKVENA